MGSDDTGGMPLKLTVSPDNTQGALASFSNPVSGQAISFTAFVSNLAQPLAPTGSVQFSVDGSNFGSPVTLTPVNGNSNESFAVSSSTSFLAAQGTQTIAFDYTNSDGNFVSGATDSHSLTATPAATTTSVVGSSANPSVVGQTVTFSVTVSVQAPAGGVPTGSVSFMEGFSTLATAALNGSGQATFSTSSLAVGNHGLAAVYDGDTNYNMSGSGTILTQVVNQASTSTSDVTSSANSTVYGQVVTLAAAVSAVSPGAGMPEGIVTFSDQNGPLGNGDVGGSINLATFTTATLSASVHTITATFTDQDGNFAGSSDVASMTRLVQTVNKASTSTGDVTSKVNPAFDVFPVTFSVNVSAVSPSVGIPTGTVTFSDQAGMLGTGTLNDLAAGGERFGDQPYFLRSRVLARGQVDFATEFPLSCLAVAPDEVGQVVQKHLAQPRLQFLVGRPLEACEIALRFEEGFLHEVRGPPLGLERRVQLAVGDQ